MVAFSKLPVMLSDEDVVDERYVNGKIYVVKCKYDDALVYVGSTIHALNIRFKGHKKHKLCSLYQYVNDIGDDWNNWYIELYEDYPCKNKYHLEKREGVVQREIENINKRIAGRTYKEWRVENREQYLQEKKEHYQRTKHERVKKDKVYYRDNFDIISEKAKQPTTCDRCGCIMRKDSINKHKRTQKCLNID